MKYAYLGRSGLQVSRLGLGTMNFGMVTDEAPACEIMDAALEAGINYFETADVYGGPQKPDIEKGYGVTEEIIGRWMAQGAGRREKIVLATKVYQPMDYGPNDRHLSAYHIRKACEDSLRRLQTDHIDLYQMLGGALKKAKEGRHYQRAEKLEKLRPQVEKYEALCDELGEEPADVAIAWLLRNPVVTAAITGPRTKEQLVKGLRAVDVELPTDTLSRLDAIWPGPGGEAPKAYAW